MTKNTIPFYVQQSITGFIHQERNHKPPVEVPAFVLVHDPTWNDHSFHTTFSLWFYDGKVSAPTQLSFLRIAHKDMSLPDNHSVFKFLPSRFLALDADFFSLGTSEDYYKEISKYFKDKNIVRGILGALRDIGFNHDIIDKVKNLEVYKDSIIRTDSAEQMIRNAVYIIEKESRDIYSLKYDFKPNRTSEAEVNFVFDKGIIPNRIYGLIGKNGTGKTTLLRDIPNHIISNWGKDNVPMYSRIIAIPGDDDKTLTRYIKSLEETNCEYVPIPSYIEDFNTRGSLIEKLEIFLDKIERHSRGYNLKNILVDFLPKNYIDMIFYKLPEHPIDGILYGIYIDVFIKLFKQMSSGQRAICYNLVHIITNIRYDSIILIDEPELYLHPNFISDFINTIFTLTKEFDSYCVFATHSPIMIQGLFSKNVYILERCEDDILTFRHSEFETFGQNLTVLTNDVFGNIDLEKQYRKTLDNLSKEYKDFNKVVESLENNSIHITLNTRLYLKGKFQ